MKLHRTVALLAACIVAAALGQPQAQERPRQGRAPQPRAREHRRADQPGAWIARIRAQLELDEKQQVEFDRIADKLRKKGGLGAHMKRQRALMEEMQRARKDGDDERAAEIRAELAEMRREARGKSPALELLDKLEHAGFLRDEQLEKLAEIRELLAARRRPGDRGPAGRVLAQVRQLREELRLTPEQAEEYDRLSAKLREALRPGAADHKETEKIVRQIMEAAEAGDTERIKELRKQMPDPGRRTQEAVARFLEEVEPILQPEQVRTLRRFRQRIGGSSEQSGLQAMFRAVRQLDLDEQQRARLRELQRETHRAAREVRRDPQALAQLTAEVRDELRDILTDEQVAEFDKWFEGRGSDKAGRPHRQRRRPRPAERDDDQP